MSTFHAYNIDYDSSESEPDDTKELQIEDALKIYQQAIKYQSEGPQSFKKAAAAYKELFASDLFKYPESLSELKRSETFPEYDELLQDAFLPVTQPLIATTGEAPNTLPQIIHLSYKNHALFILDTLKYRLSTNAADPEEVQGFIADTVQEPLGEFAEALDKDDTDLDLWRQSASIAILAGSYRIAKYCLESVLVGDGGQQEDIYDSLGIDESLAAQQLQTLHENLQDDLALVLSSLRPVRKKALISALKMLMDPYPTIPKPSYQNIILSKIGTEGKPPVPSTVDLSKDFSWTAIAKSIMEQHRAEQGVGLKTKAPRDFGPGSFLCFKKPTTDEVMTEVAYSLPLRSPTETKRFELPGKEPVRMQGPTDPGEAISPAINSAEVEEEKSADGEMPKENSGTDLEAVDAQTTSQPSRKRSTESAGLAEVPDGGRIRSKRIRAQKTQFDAIPDTAGPDTTKDAGQSEQVQKFEESDHLLYHTIQPLFARLNADDLVSPDALRDIIKTEGTGLDHDDIPHWTALQDTFKMLKNCDLSTYEVIANWTVSKISIVSREAGLSAFLGHESGNSLRAVEKPQLPSSCCLGPWVDTVNNKWTPIPELVWLFVTAFAKPILVPSGETEPTSLYLSHVWPQELRTEVWNLLVVFDNNIFGRAQEELQRIQQSFLSQNNSSTRRASDLELEAVIELLQTLFEMHIDIHSWMISAGTRVEGSQQRLHWERIGHWSLLASSAIKLIDKSWSEGGLHDLEIRHIWTQVTHVGIDQTVSQIHKIGCTRELKDLMKSNEVNHRRIQLPNNVVMPDLSLTTVETRLQRMNMKGFFLKVLGDEEKDPVVIIESLEPLLEAVRQSKSSLSTASKIELDEMGTMIATGDLTLQLPLWRRLRDAYETIGYPPKVVSCDLRTIELLMQELSSQRYKETENQQRISILAQWLVLVDDCITRVLARRDNESFLELIDEDHLNSTMSAMSQYLGLLHVARLLEDQIQIGQISPPSIEGRGTRYATIGNRINDMEIRAWILQYILFKDGVQQVSESFPAPDADRLNFLMAVHYALGARGMCKAAQKLYLKFSKEEVSGLLISDDARVEFCQILYDLHGLHCFRNSQDGFDHGLPDSEPLTKKSATRLLPFLITQTNEFTKKDPPKAELKATLEKVHGALGRPKPMETTTMNRKICVAYIKGPVNPLTIAACSRGTSSLNTRSISSEQAPIAATGWYFLMGNMALQKYRSQKRLHQINTEDLDAAAIQFLLDLESSCEKWETWHRLGQVYDAQVEEAVTWTAERVNSQSNDLINLQRASINCYAMAIACLNRYDVEETPDSNIMISELYSDLATRLYASSLEPFCMRAFAVRDGEERHFNRVESSDMFMYKRPPFRAFQQHEVWKLAARLFREAIHKRKNFWLNHYMLGKCLWKLHCVSEEVSASVKRPTIEQVLGSFISAVEELPQRDSRKEPILESHYKLVSIVHKLVLKGSLKPADAGGVLKTSWYAQKIEAPADMEGWETYVLSVLKKLRGADKAGWHHRMTVRASRIIYEGSGQDRVGASGAKNELTQSIFTKAMQVQVWKPEFERPGRHFVYTSRYVQFFLELLEKTNDRANYGLLLRKLRKKPAEFFDHKELWQDECTKYIKWLRRSGSIAEAQEDTVFKVINHEEFTKHANALEKWATVLSPENPILEILREAVEIKKINGGLMKSILVDDLIGDTYAKLYTDIAPGLTESGDIPERIAEVIASDAQQADQPVRTRIKGVGRRELLRRAEAAGSSPVAATAQILALRQTLEQSAMSPASTNGSVQVFISTPRKRSSETEEKGGDDEDVDDVAGSIHDSADDESELSELDDSAELNEFKEELAASLNANGTRHGVDIEDESPRTFLGDEHMEEGDGEEDEEENEDSKDASRDGAQVDEEMEDVAVDDQNLEAMEVDTPQ